MSESAEALLFRLLERYEVVDDLETNEKSCVDQAIRLCCGIIEADRRAVALNAKRELLAEFKLLVETRKWLTLHVRKEAGWGRAYAEVMRKMQAKYEGANQ